MRHPADIGLYPALKPALKWTLRLAPTLALGLTLCLALSGPLAAQTASAGAPAAAALSIGAQDSTHTVVAGLRGKRITLRLRSGQEVSGVVRDATDKLVLLGELSGREFFDAVVPVAAIEAVLVRTR